MKFKLPPSASGRIAGIACFIVVAVSAFSLSGTQRPPLELDPSWNVAIEYATAHHWQFGTQIVFTFGPLGFLAAPTSLGHLVGARIAFAIFWSIVVALTATALAKRFSGWVRYAFLGWLILFTLSEGLDQTAFWVLASGTLLLLVDSPGQRWQAPLYVTVIVVLALIKVSFFTAGLASLALVAVCWIRRGELKAAAGLGAGATTGFAVGWIACGQSVFNLAPWIKSGLELESGYSGAMNLAPKNPVLCFALAALMLFIGALIMMIARGPTNLFQWAAAITLAQYGFLAWKEGFTRCGDWHAFVFLWFLPLGMSFFLLNDLPGARASSHRRILNVAFVAGMVFCLAAAHFQIPGFAWQQVRAWPRRFAHNASGILRILTWNSRALLCWTAAKPHRVE